VRPRRGPDVPTTLVYHAGALGDFITALPAIAVWKRTRAPGGRLVLLGRPAHAALAAGVVDEAWDAGAPRFASLFAGDGMGPAGTSFAGLESALVFAPSGAGIVRGLAAAGIREIVRQDPFPNSRVHVVDHHLSLFPGLALNPEDVVPSVAVGAVVSMVRPIVLHPGSGSPAKNWPIERFASLAAALAHDGPIAWVVGPVEEESGIAAAIAAAPITGAATWRGLPLVELARRLAEARLFVGNDSGVAHLAAAVGCPVVVLFGASDPAVWAPRGRAVAVVGDGRCGMTAIGVDAVASAVRTALSAGGVFDRGGEGIPHG
jgi:ADP-heptose:LPS heptosyltransferase